MGALAVKAEGDAERAQLATDEREEERRAEVHRPTGGGCGRVHDHVYDRRGNREQRREDDEVGDELVKKGLWMLLRCAMWCVGHVVIRFQVGLPATSLRPCVSCRRPNSSYDANGETDANRIAIRVRCQA